MSDHQNTGASGSELEKRKTAKSSGAAADKLPHSADANVSTGGEAVKNLTPEEQMALFEKDLKENDWGHQPC